MEERHSNEDEAAASNPFLLTTGRLRLHAASLPLVTADLHHREKLHRLIGAVPASDWPPPLVDVSFMLRLKQSLLDCPHHHGFTSWYCTLPARAALVGLAGFKGRPQQGMVEIGYAFVRSYHGLGLGTEAVRALTGWALDQGVKVVRAETLPELPASRRLLQKCGYLPVPCPDREVLRYERRRVGRGPF